MKATCPTSSKHNRFATIAHMSEEWIVDEDGEFVSEGDRDVGEVVARPHPENTWTCVTCGEEAIVVS